eukprot:gene27137-2367_t
MEDDDFGFYDLTLTTAAALSDTHHRADSSVLRSLLHHGCFHEDLEARCLSPIMHPLQLWDALSALETMREADMVKLTRSSKDRRGFEASVEHTGLGEAVNRSEAGLVLYVGIMLWEVYVQGDILSTAGRPMLISWLEKGTKPVMPVETPTRYCTLVEQCFAPEPGARPTLEGLLDELSSIQNELCGKLGSDSPCRIVTGGWMQRWMEWMRMKKPRLATANGYQPIQLACRCDSM